MKQNDEEPNPKSIVHLVLNTMANGDSVPLSPKELNGIDLYYQPEISVLVIPQVGGGLPRHSTNDGLTQIGVVFNATAYIR